jgi:hypothetical protein
MAYFHKVYQQKFYAFLVSSMSAISLAHVSSTDLTTLTMKGAEYKLKPSRFLQLDHRLHLLNN